MDKFNDLPPEVRQQLWSKGIAKNDAYYLYAQKKIRTKYKRLRKLTLGFASNQIKQILDEKTYQTAEKPLEKLQAITSQKPPRKDEYEGLKKELEANALRWMKNRELIAIGYQVPRQATDAPIEVPLDAWNTFNPWSNNRFQLGSLKIEDVRVIPPALVQTHSNTEAKYNTRSLKNNLGNQKQGRTSRKEQITRAYLTLLSEGIISHNSTTKHFVYEIQNWIKARYAAPPTSSDGLSHETIRRIVRKII